MEIKKSSFVYKMASLFLEEEEKEADTTNICVLFRAFVAGLIFTLLLLLFWPILTPLIFLFGYRAVFPWESAVADMVVPIKYWPKTRSGAQWAPGWYLLVALCLVTVCGVIVVVGHTAAGEAGPISSWAHLLYDFTLGMLVVALTTGSVIAIILCFRWYGKFTNTETGKLVRESIKNKKQRICTVVTFVDEA